MIKLLVSLSLHLCYSSVFVLARIVLALSVSVLDSCRNGSTMSGSPKQVHDLLKHVSWMVGRWRTDSALCHYPTMKDQIKYIEELDIVSTGAPNLSYT